MILGTRRVPTLPSTCSGKQVCPCTPVCGGRESRAECGGDRNRNERADVPEPVNAGLHLQRFPQPPSTPRLREKQLTLTSGQARSGDITSISLPYLHAHPMMWVLLFPSYA